MDKDRSAKHFSMLKDEEEARVVEVELADLSTQHRSFEAQRPDASLEFWGLLRPASRPARWPWPQSVSGGVLPPRPRHRWSVAPGRSSPIPGCVQPGSV